ncbi:MAG: hypothetical protein IKA80_09545 [Spirochaetaceae bacterium]|nr:hypothetical protein [Spirochaetaceae bacterium]
MTEKYLGYVTDTIRSNDESKGANALLKIVAIKEHGNYRKLTSEEIKHYCPPFGQVFCPHFFNPQNADFYEGPFIEFETKPSETEKKVINQTDYIINYTSRPRAVNIPRLVTYNGKINEIITRGYLSPNEVIRTLDKINVFEGKDTKFFLYDSVEKKGIGLFKYQNHSRAVEAYYKKEVQEFIIPDNSVVFAKDNTQYLLFNEKQNTLQRGSIIDFMTNQQLADWLKSKMKNIADIDKNTLSLICNFPEFQSLEDDTEAARFERIKNKIDAFEIDIQTLVELICKHQKYFDQFVDNFELIEKEVKENFEKKYIREAMPIITKNQEQIKRQEAEISKLEETLEAEKTKALIKIEQTKAKLENENNVLASQVEEKQKQLKTLNENYDAVIATITAITPVLKNTEKSSITDEVFKICNPPFYKDVSARPYSRIKEEDEESFISFLKRHVCYQNDKLIEYFKQIKTIFSHKACFIPNIAIAFLFAKALRNTEVIIMHIEHDWLHYSDFVQHGLVNTFKAAYETPEKNYILVLDSLNITQPECGLRPLLNLISGDIPFLEGCGLSFPNNMTVMATLLSTTEENAMGLKLNPSYFQKWYAIGNPSEENDKVLLPENFWNDEIGENYGYVEPSDIPKAHFTEKAELLDKYLNF